MPTWVKETRQILMEMWGQHEIAEIAKAVNHWLADNGRMKSYKLLPVTTEGGVLFQAFKLGLITQAELDEFSRQRKRTRARQNYVPAEVRAAVLERDGHTCLLCGATQDLTIDHIVPADQGGAADMDNLQTLCQRCNRVEKAMSVIDFRKPYRKKWCEHCHRFHYENVGQP